MNGKSVFSAVILLLTTTVSVAQGLGIDETEVVFASVDKGKDILTRRDAYVERMSPFDRASRLKTDKDVSEAEYLEFIGPHVLAWNDQEKRKISSALESIRGPLETLSLPLPDTIYLIRTTGEQQGGAPYTRANAIVFPEALPKAPAKELRKVIAHEIFHILTRMNPELRHKLYESIGFNYCGEGELPEDLKSRKISNPDAPTNEHCIRVVVDGEEHLAIPVIFSSSETYDVNRGGNFFDYLEFKLLLVEKPADSVAFIPVYKGGKPRLVGVQEVSGFFEQIGNNTHYIIHPEEVLADNFALMITGARDLPSQDVVKVMVGLLQKAARE